jgi:hypothetical protein
MKNTKYNSIKIFIILATIIFNLGNFGFAQAASVSTLVDLANSSRKEEGLTSLIINDKLTEAAKNKASDMFSNQYFAHISPDGKTPWDFIRSANYDYAYAGENLSIGYVDNTELDSAWMNSLTHRENIMNKNYDEVGLAIVQGKFEGNDTTIVVEMFGQAMPIVINQDNASLEQSANNNFAVLGQADGANSVLFNNQSGNIINTSLIVLLGLSMLMSVTYLIYRFVRPRKLA